MNFVEQLKERGFKRINFEHGPSELGSPLCRSLDELGQLGQQLIEMLTRELAERGFDSQGQTITRRIFTTGWRAELVHAAADSQLNERGGRIFINPGYQAPEGDVFPFSYWPKGGRSPRELAIIAAAPGLKAMSPDDWSVFDAALEEMGLSVEGSLPEIRDIFKEARRRVEEAVAQTGCDLFAAHQKDIYYNDLNY